tara:strand:+ start:325 stop:651 length:327 start_codon:yes stop_codon:yes gene_type:complete
MTTPFKMKGMSFGNSPVKHATKRKKGHNKTYDQYPGHAGAVTYEDHQTLVPKTGNTTPAKHTEDPHTPHRKNASTKGDIMTNTDTGDTYNLKTGETVKNKRGKGIKKK